MSFLEIEFFSENRGKLPHDRDMAYHDREWSSTNRALLSLTVWKSLGRSRATSRSWPLIITIVTYSRSTITIVTVCKTDSGVLTTVAHDRDHTLPARDLQKFLVSNWFSIDFFLVSFSVLRRYKLAFRGATIFGIRAGIRSKIWDFEVEKCVECCVFWLIWGSLFWIMVFKLVKVMICI